MDMEDWELLGVGGHAINDLPSDEEPSFHPTGVVDMDYFAYTGDHRRVSVSLEEDEIKEVGIALQEIVAETGSEDDSVDMKIEYPVCNVRGVYKCEGSEVSSEDFAFEEEVEEGEVGKVGYVSSGVGGRGFVLKGIKTRALCSIGAAAATLGFILLGGCQQKRGLQQVHQPTQPKTCARVKENEQVSRQSQPSSTTRASVSFGEFKQWF